MNYFFILGGTDNEMIEVIEVLKGYSLPFYQPQQQWGDIRVSRLQLPQVALGRQLVWVECLPGDCTDRNAPIADDIYIDHHGDWNLKPASLLQVLDLLHIQPTHRQELIASIDANFLRETIAQWPDEREDIWNIWEQGYTQKFTRESDYDYFRRECRRLVDEAEFLVSNVKLIWEAPQSMTLLAALCDYQGWDSIQIVGSRKSRENKPCFFQGRADVVERLAAKDFERKYYGRRYFGCRAIPTEFVKQVEEFYL